MSIHEELFAAILKYMYPFIANTNFQIRYADICHVNGHIMTAQFIGKSNHKNYERNLVTSRDYEPV